MTEEEIIKLMQPAFRDILQKPNLIVTRDLNADQVDTWDSLNYMILILKMEEIFKVKFSADDLINLQNTGDLIDIIIQSLSKI